MLKNILTIFLIAALLILFVFSNLEKETSYKVLEVLEGDKFYIDLNQDNIKDNDELFHLKYVDSFELYYSKKMSAQAKKFSFNIPNLTALGYGAREFSRQKLEGNYVILNDIENYNPKYKYRFAKIFLNNIDYSKILLKQGFGFSYNPQKYNYYKKFEDHKQINKNLSDLSKKQIVVSDFENKTYHKPDCPEILKIKNPQILPIANVWKNFKSCKYCDISFRQKESTIKFETANPNISSGFIQLFFINPNNYEFPSKKCRTNACQALLNNINSAKNSINFAVYGFESQDEIFNALLNAKKRGVKIKGVVDSDTKGKYSYFESGKYAKEFSLIQDNKAALMHNKFFIFDNQKVFTGSSNITKTGTGGYNSNVSIIINSKDVAKYYNLELEQMLDGRFQNKKEKMGKLSLKLNDCSNLSICFSPKCNPYLNFTKPSIENAQSEILISTFYLTNKDIVNDLILAHKKGVKIKIIIDATSVQNSISQVNLLRKEGILLKVENWGGKNHQKTMLIDNKILILGSANFSKSAVFKNDENTIMINDLVLSKAYHDYFMKLYNSIHNKYLKQNPKSESFESANSCYDGIDNDFDEKTDFDDTGCIRKFLL